MKTTFKPAQNLSRAAKKMFRKYAPHLESDQRLRPDNIVMFEALCEELALYFSLEVDEGEQMIDGQNGSKVINPILRERRNVLNTILTIGKEFGMTPKGLHALGMFQTDPDKPQDAIAALMSKKPKLKAV